MVRILVTGFEPFGGHQRNISSDLVETLSDRILLDDPWTDIREYSIESLEATIDTRILSVDKAGSIDVATSIKKGQNWDAILHIGLCETCKIPRLETRAQDRIDMRIPDNDGRQISEQEISGLGDLYATAPVKSWMSLAWSIDCELSSNAGTFLCNETLYQTLSALENTAISDRQAPPCFFLHLPSEENCTLDSANTFVREILQRMMFRPVLSVVGALIIQDEHYLVARRSSSQSHAGKWEFPGGKVEPNELMTQALEREIKEEFGWHVTCENSLGTWYHSLEQIDIALHILPTSFVGKVPNFEDKGRWTAHDEIKWRTLTDSTPIDWLGNDKAVVEWMKQIQYLSTTK